MKKIKINFSLQNEKNIYKDEVEGILENEVLSYFEKVTSVKIKQNSKFVRLIRENKQYKIIMIFEKNKRKKGIYKIKEN